ncbi:porin family protein [Formosa haliotis]|uniref:porin family protein n=1 Tax=Formosa haliotis TaxID=1555194 RepID=UPI000826C3FF|nr:porin family protein [Formosa haliotis]
MKKYMLFLSALMVCLTINAQTTADIDNSEATKQIKFGVKGGVNFANLNYDGDDLDFSSKTGFSVGVMAELPLFENAVLQPEIMYSQMGAETSYRNEHVDNSSYDGTMRLNYITVPVMFKYFVIEGLSLQAGPQIGFLVASKNEYQDDFFGFENNDEMDLSDLTNSVDAGVSFGIGYQFMSHFYCDARYYLGISEVFENDIEMSNRVFQLSLGYFF